MQKRQQSKCGHLNQCSRKLHVSHVIFKCFCKGIDCLGCIEWKRKPAAKRIHWPFFNPLVQNMPINISFQCINKCSNSFNGFLLKQIYLSAFDQQRHMERQPCTLFWSLLVTRSDPKNAVILQPQTQRCWPLHQHCETADPSVINVTTKTKKKGFQPYF